MLHCGALDGEAGLVVLDVTVEAFYVIFGRGYFDTGVACKDKLVKEVRK